jgi:hypothetical protein
MTPLQNIWLTIFNFGPAIILGIYKQWWAGLLALLATFIISWALVFVVSLNLSGKAIVAWAWIKPPLIAAIVLGVGWWSF